MPAFDQIKQAMRNMGSSYVHALALVQELKKMGFTDRDAINGINSCLKSNPSEIQYAKGGFVKLV